MPHYKVSLPQYLPLKKNSIEIYHVIKNIHKNPSLHLLISNNIAISSH